jgi:protein-S-isoprenylcysteine O-methyltransferase Ste14
MESHSAPNAAPRYDRRQRGVALVAGVVCHVSFTAAIVLMVVSLYFGLAHGAGPFHGATAIAANALLVVQFAVLHSALLTERGARWLARLAPLGLGRDLATTTFATIASWQLLLTFGAWSPIGPVWWQPRGAAWIPFALAYAASWGFLLKAMRDAGLSVQSGFLGWGSVVRGRAPAFEPFAARGSFRFVRQPIYLAFALTLWTAPVWTPDRLLVAVGWTAYCLAGPLLKERRYLRHHGATFARYRSRVPYWLPSLRAFNASDGA